MTETVPEELPPVVAHSAINAEERHEPVRSAEVAFTAGDMISKVLVERWQTVKEGETLSWLGLVVMISGFASIFPARGATRIRVRNSLAYQK